MHEFGLRLARNLKAGDLVVLTGPLGAGKTTLTRGVGEGLKTIGTVSSPTFVIARTHEREGSNTPLVHVDAYRLSTPAEFDDLDIDIENSITLVEWGKGFVDDLTDSWLEIEIDRSEDERVVTVTGFGPGWQERVLA
jgi:tRNA threonylcarbamoyl adenosine modification protein YjeE